MRRLVLAVIAIAACRGSDDAVPPSGPPVELADEQSLAELVAWDELPIPKATRLYRQQSSVDRGTGVDGGVRLLRNGNKDLNNWICASSDAELGKPLVPAGFDLPACPEAYVHGAVAARFEGSGALTRFWMTAFSMRETPADDEVLRVYVDDELVVEQKIAAVADGSAGEMFAPPFGAGAKQFVSWRYPVVFGRKLIIALDNLGTLDNVYHITDVALDRTPRARKRSTTQLPRERAAKLRPAQEAAFSLEKTLDAGVSEKIAITQVVDALSIARPDLLRDVRIRVSFEGVTTIDLPVSELFAAWEEMPASSSLALAAEGDRVTLRLPLSAHTIELTNNGAASVAVSLRASTSGSGKGGRLWAVRNETIAPASGTHPLFSTTGPGRWVGACALLEGHAMSGSDALVGGLNFLEGDERVTLDGVTLPGTGTEDYFDSAFYFLGGARSSPFAAWWGVREDRATTPWRGSATACRWHVLNDAIDFQSAIDATLEIGNGDPSLLDRYRSVAFFYK
jgi:hypothetical protein